MDWGRGVLMTKRLLQESSNQVMVILMRTGPWRKREEGSKLAMLRWKIE